MRIYNCFVVMACLLCSTATIAQRFSPAFDGQTQLQRSPTTNIKIDILRSDLKSPWALAFLPDGRLLVTQKQGQMLLLDLANNLKFEIKGLPAVAAMGQGGLLDVAIDPKLSQNGWIYWTYAEVDAKGLTGTAAARGQLDLATLTLKHVQVIYRQTPKVNSGQHFGSRIVPTSDGYAYITLGDRGSFSDQAQQLGSGIGKIIRIRTDGTIPKDNPYLKQRTALPALWSIGHRNVQGAALDPNTQALWTIEHGAKGGDELNQPKAGRNYGWPIITYGDDYSGESIGIGTQRSGLEQPIYYWNPVIAPSGMTFYQGRAFPNWQGNILIAGLRSQALVRLIMKNGRVQSEERYSLGVRCCDVQVGADGLIYVVTDVGTLLRLNAL
jgi:glucose/arabinose dehydrogenase